MVADGISPLRMIDLEMVMAWYRDNSVVQRTGEAYAGKYDKVWKPGNNPEYPGIYKCQKCGYEDVINRECDSLPPCSNCGRGSMEWKLVVRAMDAGK